MQKVGEGYMGGGLRGMNGEQCCNYNTISKINKNLHLIYTPAQIF